MPETENYDWNLPTVGGDNGAWGTELNETIEAIDAELKSVSDVADAALPKAGGVMSGRLDSKTSSMARVDKGSVSGSVSLDLAVANYFTMTLTGATTLTFTNVPTGTFATAMILRIVNGGALVTWPASVDWPSATTPTLTAAGTDLVALITDDNGTTWRGMVVGRDLR